MAKIVFNYPVAPSAPRETYRAALARALNDLKSFAPDLIAVSAGFDGYARDPLAQGTLLTEDFYWLGKELRSINIPFFQFARRRIQPRFAGTHSCLPQSRGWKINLVRYKPRHVTVLEAIQKSSEISGQKRH
ncbi:MAG: hypothetical protein WDM76_12235 [Limisphaerales bacterium]